MNKKYKVFREFNFETRKQTNFFQDLVLINFKMKNGKNPFFKDRNALNVRTLKKLGREKRDFGGSFSPCFLSFCSLSLSSGFSLTHLFSVGIRWHWAFHQIIAGGLLV